MINEYEAICSKINNYDWHPSYDSFENKVYSLNIAITQDLDKIVNKITVNKQEIHLAYSGGVDSTIILFKLLKYNIPIFAHTIASSENHFDFIYAKKVLSSSNILSSVKHIPHILSVKEDDLIESNNILESNDKRPDNYYYLMRSILHYTQSVINCDIIDELLGGYYLHYGPNIPMFYDCLNKLIKDHLYILNKISTHFNIEVFLPYGGDNFMHKCESFSFDELVGINQRKKPVYEIAKLCNIPEYIMERKKMGLVSAL